MTVLLCPFEHFRPAGKDGDVMKTNKIPQISTNCSAEVRTDYLIETFGTNDVEEQLNDTLGAALKRYMNARHIGTGKLARRTGLSKCTISRYKNGTATYINENYLYAICIALRLRPCQQRQLLKVAHVNMPDEWGKNRTRAFTIRDFLDGCSYDDRYTVAACNARLVEIGAELLTQLVPNKEDKL